VTTAQTLFSSVLENFAGLVPKSMSCVLLNFWWHCQTIRAQKWVSVPAKEGNLLPLQACKWMSEQLHAEIYMHLLHFPAANETPSACQSQNCF